MINSLTFTCIKLIKIYHLIGTLDLLAIHTLCYKLYYYFIILGKSNFSSIVFMRCDRSILNETGRFIWEKVIY